MKEKTKTWFKLANEDLNFAKNIIQNKQRPRFAVHFCHQAIEKMLKALVQELSFEDPKRTHSFKILCEQAKLVLPQKIEEILVELSPHYLASKYPEDIQGLLKNYKLKYVKSLYLKTEEAFKWLKTFLNSKK